MCRYHRFVVSWRPTIKASREHVHGSAFDVRSLISIHLEMVLIKNVLFSLVYGEVFMNGNLVDCVPPFSQCEWSICSTS